MSAWTGIVLFPEGNVEEIDVDAAHRVAAERAVEVEVLDKYLPGNPPNIEVARRQFKIIDLFKRPPGLSYP